jgi:surface protein
MTKITPQNKEELEALIEKEMETHGINVDLNHIDISLMTNLSFLFFDSPFNGNISKWNTSNVTDMESMFEFSSFNGDISNWNVSKVEDMFHLFSQAVEFNQNLSSWTPLKLNNSKNIFESSACSAPYWAYCENNAEIRQKIEVYQITKENLKLKKKFKADLNVNKTKIKL